MLEEARRNPRLIGGVYQVGQVITTGPMLTVYSAYNRNTSDACVRQREYRFAAGG